MSRLILPSRFRQRGSITHFQSGVAASGGLVITLAGGAGGDVIQVDPISPYDSSVAIRFNPDGTVETGNEINGGGINWSDDGTWIDPLGEADGTYDVRFTNLSQIAGVGNWTIEAAADDTWINLGAQRVWVSTKTVAGERRFSVDFEVRKNAGAPPATGSSFWDFRIDNII